MKFFKPFLIFLPLFLYNCNYEDNDVYTSPCKGKFGSQKVLDSLTKKFNFRDGIFYFNETHKNYNGPALNCDTINLDVSDDNVPVITTDAFLSSCSSIFFNDTANTNIKYLKITAVDLWPYKGDLKAVYLLDRNSSNTYVSSNPCSDTVNYSIEDLIMKAIPFAGTSSLGTIQGLRIEAKLPSEPCDVKKIAAEIKKKYDEIIKEKSLGEFQIDLSVAKPNNMYCVSKTYHFFYTKKNKDF
jgi:hypothetical protein